MQGLVDGIKNIASAPVDAVKNVGSGILNGFKGFFGISSPSRLMMQQGGFLAQGLADGIIGTLGEVQNAMNRIQGIVGGSVAAGAGQTFNKTINQAQGEATEATVMRAWACAEALRFSPA